MKKKKLPGDRIYEISLEMQESGSFKNWKSSEIIINAIIQYLNEREELRKSL